MRGAMIAGSSSAAIGWFLHGFGFGILLVATIGRFSHLATAR